MPDFERAFRDLTLHMAKSSEEKAFLQGYYLGKDQARWEVVVAFCAMALVVIATILLVAGKALTG